MNDKIGLIGYEGGGMVKPYSEYTGEVIDEEVRQIVKDCYQRTENLILEKKELIQK